jgi:hypothetical protein
MSSVVDVMKTVTFILLAMCSLCVGAAAQKPKTSGPAAPTAAKAPEPAAENELAKLAFQAHGGDKLKAVKTLIVSGSLDFTSTAFTQAMPGTFAMVIAGDKYVLDMRSMQSFKQSFDGTNTYSTVSGITLPPVTSLGLPLLQKYGQTGYVVGPLPAGAKKRRGFRMTAPDGAYTDFFVDEKTNQISGYESSFEIRGNAVTTSAIVDKYRNVDGVLIPEKYAQRFDLGQFTAYVDFKAKDIAINREVDDSVFAGPK